MKTRIAPKHLHMTSLIITAVSLAISANQPVNAGSTAVGADTKTPVVARKTKPIKVSSVSSPEAGVQLLIGILQRIGNEPQIALQKNQRMDDAPSSQMFLASQNSLDPALVIRPQAQAKQQVRKKSEPAAAAKSDQIIAMMPRKSGGGASGARFQFEPNVWNPPAARRSSTHAGTAAGATAGAAAPAGAGAPTASEATVDQLQGAPQKPGNSWGNMRTNINKLYQATKFVEEITGNKRAEADAGAAGDELANSVSDTEAKVIRTGNYARGTTISHLPKIMDYSKDATRQASAAPSQGLVMDQRKNAPAELEFKKAEPASDKTYAKLENANAYRTLKEYPSAPADGAAGEGFPGTTEKSKSRSPLSAPGMHVAYLPPQLVSGIPGLRLGVSETQVDAYLKGRGTVSRQTFNGWKVWSLADRSNKTLLQVYVRNGIVEAYRVFDQSFVPEGLGVALNDKIDTMKKKFGEAQFTLNEPSSIGRKNYVYPVNQVSFQLARENPKDPITVKSLLLFQFI